MASFRHGETSATAGADTLKLSRSRFYQLYSDYLRAVARRQQQDWSPGLSGGNHAPLWPAPVEPLLRKLLSARPPAPYRFVGSEVHRRLGIKIDPATVRRWAIGHQLAHPLSPPRRPASLRRWQCLKVGALWQLDATPHRWFPGNPKNYPLLDLLDDCSRLCTGAKIYYREDLLAYLDFLPAAFREHGLPLELYVDCHSLFFPQNPDSLTQLGSALHFYGVSLRYAQTPQAKGKIERQHQYWQGRLPPLFSAESITTPEGANALLPQLRRHRNANETHRELGRTPKQAFQLAQREKRSVLRPPPRCPWWPYIWSLRTQLKIGPDGRVPIGSQRLRVGLGQGHRIVHCLHPDGSITILASEPKPGQRPAVLLHVPSS
jgi:hypothetical protein